MKMNTAILIENYMRRLYEILDELGNVGKIFENSATSLRKSDLHQIVESVNKLRIPGFRAYHLSQEGLSLLNLIGIEVALGKLEAPLLNEHRSWEDLELQFQKTIKEMEIYKSLDSEKIIETIIGRRGKK